MPRLNFNPAIHINPLSFLCTSQQLATNWNRYILHINSYHVMPTWLGSRDPIRLQDVILANVVVKPPEIGRLKLSAEKQGHQRCCHLRRLKDESTWRTIITTSDNLVILRNRWKILKNFHHCHDNFISLSWHSKCENVPKVQARFFAEASPRHWHPCLEKHDRSCGLAASLLDHQKLQLNHQVLTFRLPRQGVATDFTESWCVTPSVAPRSPLAGGAGSAGL